MPKVTHKDLVAQIRDLRSDTHRDTEQLRGMLMSLDQSVVDVLQAQADALKTMATDLGEFEKNAQAKLDAFQVTVDGLKAGDVLTAAELADLKANAAAFDANVIAPIQGFTKAIQDMDASLKPVVPPTP